MISKAGKYIFVLLAVTSVVLSVTAFSSCDYYEEEPHFTEYSRTIEDYMKQEGCYFYTDENGNLIVSTSSDSSEESIPFPEASEFLDNYVPDFEFYRELINSRLATVPSENQSDSPYERVISDRCDTKKGIVERLSSFMPLYRVNEEMEFLTAPTTADGKGPSPYIFKNGVTYMNTELSNSFYPGTWDTSSAEYIFILEDRLRISFRAKEDEKDLKYTADFILENGIWLLDNVF